MQDIGLVIKERSLKSTKPTKMRVAVGYKS